MHGLCQFHLRFTLSQIRQTSLMDNHRLLTKLKDQGSYESST